MGTGHMMGRQTGDQSQLFYLFNLGERIPANHLLIDWSLPERQTRAVAEFLTALDVLCL